jgi:tRNA pseudouridine13 synthase
MSSSSDQLTYLTADLPGVGGVIKQRPQDFLVEELPLYEPSGEGEHLYLFIEKKNATTHELIRRLAKAFRLGRSDIGHAGLKDKHAVTRQHLSVHTPGWDNARTNEALERFKDYPYANVLWADRHTNKLKRGHHGGNRFSIRIREVEPTSVIRAKPILDRLCKVGLPNYLGEQRFGYRQNSHILGGLLLRGEYQQLLDAMLGRPLPHESEPVRQAREAYDAGDIEAALSLMPKSLRHDRQALDALRQGKDAEQAVMSIDRSQRDLLLSAWQSAVFNRVCGRRIKDGLLQTLIPGDLAWKHDNRACFSVDETTTDSENQSDGRVAKLEISPSGPLWGPDMTRPDGEVLDTENKFLHEAGFISDDLNNLPHGIRLEGKRRPLRVPVRNADLSGGVDEHGAYIRLSFDLPRGSYATMLIREITKAEASD